MVQRTTPYGFSATLKVSFEQAVPLATGALKDEGFGVLTEIDVKATLKQKLDAEFRRYVILGACNPQLARRALETDLAVGLLLPCNVIVYEDGPGAVVAIADPVAMLDVISNPALRSVAEEAKARLTKVLQRLSAS